MTSKEDFVVEMTLLEDKHQYPCGVCGNAEVKDGKRVCQCPEVEEWYETMYTKLKEKGIIK